MTGFKRNTALFLQVFMWLIVTAPAVYAVSGQLNLPSSEPQIPEAPSMTWMFIKLLVSLVVIAGLTYLTVRVLRRNLNFSSAGDSIKILDQHAFALNKGIYITEVAGRVYVLGVTDHNITILSEIEDAGVIAELRSRAEERMKEPVIPTGLIDKLVPNLKNQTSSQVPTFGTHIQEQIKKLHSLVEKTKKKRDGDTDEK